MILSSSNEKARSMLISPSIVTSRGSSSVDSTTSVGCSKETTHHRSLSPRPTDEDRCPPKKVDFSRKVRVKLISSRDRFSDKERCNIWYSSEEYMAIRQSAINTVTKMAKNKNVDMDPTDCSRGLEGKTPQQDALRQERRRIIMWSVLAEQQEKHLDDFVTRSQAISAAYSLCNRSCAYEAEMRGELDAIEAWGIAVP